jgi:hypothetical protein
MRGQSKASHFSGGLGQAFPFTGLGRGNQQKSGTASARRRMRPLVPDWADREKTKVQALACKITSQSLNSTQ